MAKIIRNVHEHPLPEDQIFALKYADLEACFVSRSKQDVYLDVVFKDKQFADKKLRDRLEAQGIFQLLKFKYDPANRLMTAWERANGPWKDVENPIIVETWIYGLPKMVCSKTGLSGPRLQEILSGELKEFFPKNKPWKEQRKLTLRLLAKEASVECTATLWDGADGQCGETTTIVPLGGGKGSTSSKRVPAAPAPYKRGGLKR